MKISVIIGRFQSSYLHEGHKHILNFAIRNGDRLMVLIGSRPGNPTSNNPLSFAARKEMIKHSYPNAVVREVMDNKSDAIWSKSVDEIIYDRFPDSDITLFGSRDSFIEHYKGKYKTHFVEQVSEKNATEIREKAANEIIQSEEWRSGAIHSIHRRFPISYQCVDIAIIKNDPPSAFNKEVLVGKKAGEEKWRFIGGFVDVKDESLERAAKREVTEECGGIETDSYKYIGSTRIDDWRYRGTGDGVMTSFFICDYIYGMPKASDDINEVKFISALELKTENFEPEHHVLVEMLVKYLQTHINLHV